jgi:hypothetical protein
MLPSLLCLSALAEFGSEVRSLESFRSPDVGTVGDANLIQYSPQSNIEGEQIGNLASALQELRAERKQAQSHVEKLDTAISVIESLNGSGTVRQENQPTRVRPLVLPG